jgi:demethylmenaquinone methyltransferase/2-methoxy-6-polyprenyl-1,4-benzoquinol methylase
MTIPETIGSRPQGAVDEATSAKAVQRMFDEIAPRYDLLNSLLSANVAKLWWKRTARAFQPILSRPDSAIVDLCCGTGSLTLELEKLRPADAEPILAIDFSHPMLALGARRFAPTAFATEANAMELPLADNSVDLITTAFGFRNLPNYDAALREMHRVLRPGGVFAILEANEPRGVTSGLYRLYFHHVVPWIGSLFSSRSAYSYLPASVGRFPQPDELLPRIRAAGFPDASWTPYTLGIAGLYSCRK